MTDDIFYVFQHTCGTKARFEYDNLLKKHFYGIIFYDNIENTIIFALELRLKYKAIELVVETKYLCGKFFFNMWI